MVVVGGVNGFVRGPVYGRESNLLSRLLSLKLITLVKTVSFVFQKLTVVALLSFVRMLVRVGLPEGLVIV